MEEIRVFLDKKGGRMWTLMGERGNRRYNVVIDIPDEATLVWEKTKNGDVVSTTIEAAELELTEGHIDVPEVRDKNGVLLAESYKRDATVLVIRA